MNFWGSMGWIGQMLLQLIILILLFLLSATVYKDARELRKMNVKISPIGWAIAAFFFSVHVCIVYAILRLGPYAKPTLSK